MSPATRSHGLQWPQVVGLTVAGVAAFVIAFGVQRWGQAGADEKNDIVAPVDRANKAPNSKGLKGQSLPNFSNTSANQPMVRTTDPTPVAGTSLSSQVIYNPFGNLNLMASAELTEKPVALQDSNRSGSRRVKKADALAAAPIQPQAPNAASLPSPQPTTPTAPPVPFTVVGAIRSSRIADGNPVAFLRQRDEVLAVRKGDAVGQNYRVDNITAERIEFTYLPLKQSQSLALTP